MTEPIDQPPNHTRRNSVLATSIVARNPHLAERSDRELVAAHFRAMFTDRMKVLNAWADCQTTNKKRNAEYASRVESLRNMIQRESGVELQRLGMTLEESNDIAAALIADDAEYRAAMTTLNDRLFA